jgi:hypothetical protein
MVFLLYMLQLCQVSVHTLACMFVVFALHWRTPGTCIASCMLILVIYVHVHRMSKCCKFCGAHCALTHPHCCMHHMVATIYIHASISACMYICMAHNEAFLPCALMLHACVHETLHHNAPERMLCKRANAALTFAIVPRTLPLVKVVALVVRLSCLCCCRFTTHFQ